MLILVPAAAVFTARRAIFDARCDGCRSSNSSVRPTTRPDDDVGSRHTPTPATSLLLHGWPRMHRAARRAGGKLTAATEEIDGSLPNQSGRHRRCCCRAATRASAGWLSESLPAERPGDSISCTRLSCLARLPFDRLPRQHTGKEFIFLNYNVELRQRALQRDNCIPSCGITVIVVAMF